jgi:hypothetical protein
MPVNVPTVPTAVHAGACKVISEQQRYTFFNEASCRGASKPARNCWLSEVTAVPGACAAILQRDEIQSIALTRPAVVC